MSSTNGNGGPAPARRPERRSRSSWCSRSTSRISRSRIRTRRARCSKRTSRRSTSQINVNAKPLAETDVEVELKLEGKAEVDGTRAVQLRAGLRRRVPHPERAAGAACSRSCMIECPRLLFPFAREIIATSVRNGGFPPLLLDPIDFVALYQQRMAQVRRRPAAAGRRPDRKARPRHRLGRYSCQIAASPSVAMNARCAARSSSVDPRRERLRPHANDDRRHARLAGRRVARREAERSPAARRSARHRPRPATRRRAARRAWCGANCRSGSARRDRRAGWSRRDACGAPASACRPGARAPTGASLGALQLGIEEAEIEHRVVRDQRRVAEEFEQLLDHRRRTAACPSGTRR